MSKKRFTDYFDLLEVERNATKEEIQKAFMIKASIWHPDKADSEQDREYYTKMYQDLQSAYKVLSNDNSRKQYCDAQQTTDLEFKFAERNVTYENTDAFKDKSGKFDKTAFNDAFNQTRDEKEMSEMNKLNKNTSNGFIRDSDIKSFLNKRDEQLKNINEETQQIFNGTGTNFDKDTFNRAFDYMKDKSPGTGVQLYEGDPMSLFSGGGLVECDTMAPVQFKNGTDFTGQTVDNLVQGQSVNPGSNFDLTSLQTGESYGTEQRLTNQEVQSKMNEIQRDREQLATMDKSEFVIEPSEIEKVYSSLFEPMDMEGLDSPNKSNTASLTQ